MHDDLTLPSQRNRSQSPRIPVLAGLEMLAATLRLVPHSLNFTPIGALALLGGAWFTHRRVSSLFAFQRPVLDLPNSRPSCAGASCLRKLCLERVSGPSTPVVHLSFRDFRKLGLVFCRDKFGLLAILVSAHASWIDHLVRCCLALVSRHPSGRRDLSWRVVRSIVFRGILFPDILRTAFDCPSLTRAYRISAAGCRRIDTRRKLGGSLATTVCGL